MKDPYSLTPLNLALDGTLEQFIELYNLTYKVYKELLKEHTSLQLLSENDRQVLNSYAIERIILDFEHLAFKRLRIFTTKFRFIHLSKQHFKRFDFFDQKKINNIEIKKKIHSLITTKNSNSAKTNDFTDNFSFFDDIIIDLDIFLECFRSVVMRAIYEMTVETNPSYTIIQVGKHVNERINERMKLRHAECIIPNSSTQPPTKQPLYLYYALNNIGCKQNKHSIISKKYYIQHIDGKNTIVIPVHYCENCKRYLCGQFSFSLFKEFFGKLIVDIRNLSPHTGNEWHMQNESKLHQLGYNVIEGELTASERKNILISIMESNQLTFFEIVATIEQNIRIFETNYRMRNAVKKWKNDLGFINDYMLNKMQN